jgi:hypothetical protein
VYSAFVDVSHTTRTPHGLEPSNAGPAVMLFAVSSRQVLFELLLHGGNAASLVEWWERFPTESFCRRLYVARHGPQYGNFVFVMTGGTYVHKNVHASANFTVKHDYS